MVDVSQYEHVLVLLKELTVEAFLVQSAGEAYAWRIGATAIGGS